MRGHTVAIEWNGRRAEAAVVLAGDLAAARGLEQLMVWHHTETFSGEPSHEAAMRRAHRKIASAIARGDAAAAEKAMRQHVVAEEQILAEHGGLERSIVPDSAWRPADSWAGSPGAPPLR